MPVDRFEHDLDALSDAEEPILDPSAEPDDPAELAGGDRLSTPLDDLIEDLTSEVEGESEPIRLKVPGRPGYVALFTRNIDARRIRLWERQSTKTRRGEKDTDAVMFNGLILVNTNEGLERNGEPVINPDTGEPLTFRDKWFVRLYQAPSAIEAVRKFYGRDAFYMAAGDGVMVNSGYGDEAEEAQAEDPT